ncbi:zinc finger, CCHC-type containing protein, partial [Tanacetum coccineum]
MVVAAIKNMASNFVKLDKFKGVNFRRGLILNGMANPLFDIYHNVESFKELWDSLEAKYMVEDVSSKKFLHTLKHNKELTLVELGSHLRIEESLMVQDSDKPKGNNVVGPSVVNMVEHNNSFRYNDNKGKCKHQDTKADPNKKSKDDDVAWWVDSGATVHLFNIVNDNIASAFMLTSKLNDSILWHARLGHVYFKRMQDMSKNGLIPAFDMTLKSDEALDKFKVFKTKVELQQGSLIKRFWTDIGGEYMDTLYFQSIDIIHKTTAPYTPQQKGEKGIECIFVGYAKHSKAFRFYVIEPNELVSINSINESRDAIFDENIFSSVPRPSQRSLINKTKDIGDSVVPEEVTKEVVAQQPEPELRKKKK